MMLRTMQHVMLGTGMLLIGNCLISGVSVAQDTKAPQEGAGHSSAAPSKAPDALDLYFDNGSSKVRSEDLKLLDKASRLYAEGKPIVMIVAGSTDLVGSPASNLRLSQARADNVVRGLVARGIPVERFQVLAKGVSDLPVPTDTNAAEPRNRRVEITWR